MPFEQLSLVMEPNTRSPAQSFHFLMIAQLTFEEKFHQIPQRLLGNKQAGNKHELLIDIHLEKHIGNFLKVVNRCGRLWPCSSSHLLQPQGHMRQGEGRWVRVDLFTQSGGSYAAQLQLPLIALTPGSIPALPITCRSLISRLISNRMSRTTSSIRSA